MAGVLILMVFLLLSFKQFWLEGEVGEWEIISKYCAFLLEKYVERNTMV